MPLSASRELYECMYLPDFAGAESGLRRIDMTVCTSRKEKGRGRLVCLRQVRFPTLKSNLINHAEAEG